MQKKNLFFAAICTVIICWGLLSICNPVRDVNKTGKQFIDIPKTSVPGTEENTTVKKVVLVHMKNENTETDMPETSLTSHIKLDKTTQPEAPKSPPPGHMKF